MLFESKQEKDMIIRIFEKATWQNLTAQDCVFISACREGIAKAKVIKLEKEGDTNKEVKPEKEGDTNKEVEPDFEGKEDVKLND
jgi:hypothetical protein